MLEATRREGTRKLLARTVDGVGSFTLGVFGNTSHSVQTSFFFFFGHYLPAAFACLLAAYEPFTVKPERIVLAESDFDWSFSCPPREKGLA